MANTANVQKLTSFEPIKNMKQITNRNQSAAFKAQPSVECQYNQLNHIYLKKHQSNNRSKVKRAEELTRYSSSQTLVISALRASIAAGVYCIPGNTSVSRLCSKGISSATNLGTTVSITDWMRISCSGSLSAVTTQQQF